MTLYIFVLLITSLSSATCSLHGMQRMRKAIAQCAAALKHTTQKRALATAAQTYAAQFEKHRKEYYAKVLDKPWAAVAKERIAKLDERNAQLQKKIFGACPPTHQEKEATRLECQQESVDIVTSNATPQNVSDTVKLQCTQVLREHCVKPGSVLVVAHEKCDTMASSQSIIYLGKKFLHSPAYMKLWHMRNPHHIKAVALHELQHLMHDDLVNLALARRRVALVNDYKCFVEERADIMAGLYSPNYARALASHYLSLESLYLRTRYALQRYTPKDYAQLSPRDGEPHPLARATYLMQLHDRMKAYEK